MAAPRVFISSTFYDLKQHRSIIGEFVKSLGYEPIMHERSSVAYTQNKPLEMDCYSEVSTCDIVVCIIGNHFGSSSSENDLSITMNEINTALKAKKKVYIFIAQDVYTENRTYKLNKDTENFKSAYTDNLKIHEFISELTDKVRNHFISPFDTTDQIISVLKSQFAGLFQNLLQRESSLTEAQTVYDIQQSADIIKTEIRNFIEEKEDFFAKFDSTMLGQKLILGVIKKHLDLEKCSFFARDLSALDELMEAFGYDNVEPDDFEDVRKYEKSYGDYDKVIVIKDDAVDEDEIIKDIRSRKEAEKLVVFSIVEKATEEEIPDEELPF